MAKALRRSYVAPNMKATPSSPAGEDRNEQPLVTRVPISAWEEETFALTVRDAGVEQPVATLADWESIEAVGAADDPARFRIEFEMTEPAASHP